jgi:spermidine synthase
MTAMHRLHVGLLLFGSGLAALVYQVAWIREFRLIFGASTAATAAVLAVFIGGLGAGGLILGARADRSSRPLRLYGAFELGAAAFAAISPLLLWLVRVIYVGLGGSASLGLFGGTCLRLLLGALVLAGPTLLMGGAMPAAVAAVEVDEDVGRRNLALIYGLNTLGAVTGCVLANFVLLELLGTRKTLWSATLLGAAVALVALAWSGRRSPTGTPSASEWVAVPAAPANFVLFAAGLVGFAFFLMEMVWYRMLGPLLGGTVFSFGIILAVALLGIGVGSVLHGLLQSRGRLPATLTGFAGICLVEALAVAAPFALGDRVALLALFLRPLGNLAGFWGHAACWALIASIVILPAALAAGVQFPVLIALLGRGRADVGRQTGRVYAANTVGAIAGSLAGGFGMLPLLTAPGCWQFVAALLGLLALVAYLVAQRTAGRPRGLAHALPSLLASALLATLLFARGPTAVWRHSPIAVGRVNPASLVDATALRDFENGVRRSIERDDEGVESSVALERSTGYAFILNGKTDGHARMDAGTQVMGGLLGALLHPNPRRAFVIGLGTGSTSGWLAAVPSIERVDSVELEPAILEVARKCAAVNHSVLDNPKHRVIIGDARETLLARGDAYDIIASEPSNPYRAGIASLFTREYYQAVNRRLAQGGIFLQWVQAYAIDGQTLLTIMATLAQVFPSVEIWRMAPSDLLLVATRTELVHDVAQTRARMQQEPFRAALLGAWSTVTLEGVLAHHVARPSLVRRVAELQGSTINTDDRTRVEFGFARSLTGTGNLHAGDVEELARARGEDRPVLVGGDVDEALIADEEVGFAMSLGIAPGGSVGGGDEQRTRSAALSEWISSRYANIPTIWRRQPSEPRTLVEMMVVGDGLAEIGDDEALRMIEQLRPLWPSVAAGIEARLLLRQDKRDEALRVLEASLIAYRTDPWPPPTFMLRTMNLAVETARGYGPEMQRLFATLSAPFAVHMMDEARASALVTLAKAMPPGPACARALSFFEPDIPWNVDFLSFRTQCYQSIGSNLAPRAHADLRTFLAHNPSKLPAALVK